MKAAVYTSYGPPDVVQIPSIGCLGTPTRRETRLQPPGHADRQSLY
jgi:hypothetical protein